MNYVNSAEELMNFTASLMKKLSNKLAVSETMAFFNEGAAVGISLAYCDLLSTSRRSSATFHSGSLPVVTVPWLPGFCDGR